MTSARAVPLQDIPVPRQVYAPWKPSEHVIEFMTECPVCGRQGVVEVVEDAPGRITVMLGMLAEVRPAVYAYTCWRHGLSDVYALHHRARR